MNKEIISNPKVNIVLSSYNGEKYIEEQINSLLRQTYKNISIYIRDDGSTDNTRSILRKYSGRVFIIEGQNVGFCQSFFELLKFSDTGDYWSFCDQDDIWFEDKIQRAVEFLENEPQKNIVPLLYYSFSKMINDAEENIGIQLPPEGSLCFRRMMTGTFGVGFSMVINGELRKKILRCDPKAVGSHDWLAGAIALGLGKVIVDERISALYRRLDTSVTKVSLKRRIQWFLSTFKDGGEVRARNIEFSRNFYHELSGENKKIIELFNSRRYSIKKALLKFYYPKRWRPSLSSEIIMRLLMLFGKV